MKAQLDLLEWMVLKSNVQEECFQIEGDRLTIDVDGIYLLNGLSHYGVDISLYGHRWGGETTTTYLVQHYSPGSKLKDIWIDIKTIDRIHLRTIYFTVARLCGSAALHLLTKAQIHISVEFS